MSRVDFVCHRYDVACRNLPLLECGVYECSPLRSLVHWKRLFTYAVPIGRRLPVGPVIQRMVKRDTGNELAVGRAVRSPGIHVTYGKEAFAALFVNQTNGIQRIVVKAPNRVAFKKRGFVDALRSAKRVGPPTWCSMVSANSTIEKCVRAARIGRIAYGTVDAVPSEFYFSA